MASEPKIRFRCFWDRIVLCVLAGAFSNVVIGGHRNSLQGESTIVYSDSLDH